MTVQSSGGNADTSCVVPFRSLRRWPTTTLALLLFAALVGACGSSASDSTLTLRHGSKGYLVAGQYGVLWYQLEGQEGNLVRGTFEKVGPDGAFVYSESGTVNGNLISLTGGDSSNGGDRIGASTFHATSTGLVDSDYTYRNATTAGFASAVAAVKARWTREGLDRQPVSGLYRHQGNRTDTGYAVTLTIAPQPSPQSDLLIEVNVAVAQDRGRTQRRVEQLAATATAGTLNVSSDTHSSGPWSKPFVATYSTVPATITFPFNRCSALWIPNGGTTSGCTFTILWVGQALPPSGILALPPSGRP